MNIQLTSIQSLSLAEDFANTIHGELMNRHAIRAWGIWPIDAKYTPPARMGESFKEVCAAVRSISDKWERIHFIAQIRYYFNAKCAQHGTERKWQDYVASVRAAYAAHAEAFPTATSPAPTSPAEVAV